MRENSSNSDKRNAIISIAFAEPVNLLFVDYPGNMAYVTGSFEPIKFSDIDFTETDPENGAPIDQELTITLRGLSKEVEAEVNDITGKYLILKIGYSNGDFKIMGTPDNPVTLISAMAGRTTVNTLSAKRSSAEKAKYIIVS